MSPGATFERVYNELKRMLAEGELPPGTPIEPALIGKQIAASITPIRDALHRLTGERLVEAPNHNGFRVPLPAEAELRDLYDWNAKLLVLAVGNRWPAIEPPSNPHALAAGGIAIATATLFAQVARCSGSAEHVQAIERLNHRLAPMRRAETVLFENLDAELTTLVGDLAGSARAPAKTALMRYHRRRLRLVPEIVALLRDPGV